MRRRVARSPMSGASLPATKAAHKPTSCEKRVPASLSWVLASAHQSVKRRPTGRVRAARSSSPRLKREWIAPSSHRHAHHRFPLRYARVWRRAVCLRTRAGLPLPQWNHLLRLKIISNISRSLWNNCFSGGKAPAGTRQFRRSGRSH